MVFGGGSWFQVFSQNFKDRSTVLYLVLDQQVSVGMGPLSGFTEHSIRRHLQNEPCWERELYGVMS